MTAARVRITDLIDADAGSPRYCGHSIGRVLTVEQDGLIRHVLVSRIERSGDRVYGIGTVVPAARAEAAQLKWDVRWGIRCAPVSVPTPEHRSQASGKTKLPATIADVDAAAAAIVAVGYRELAKRHHPDTGGSHNAMSLLTQAHKQLKKILDLAKGGTI